MLEEKANDAHNTFCKLSENISKLNIEKSKKKVKTVYDLLIKANEDFRKYGYPIKNEPLMLKLKEDLYFLDALSIYLEKKR